MISLRENYVRSEENKLNEKKESVESNRDTVILIRRNINPPTILQVRAARLRKVMRRRLSSII